MKKIIALTLFDLKYVYRDFMLIVSIVAPLLLALLFRFAIPFISTFVEGRFSLNLLVYEELFAIMLLLVVPVMQGLFAAFIILDEQDEDILTFLSVTPLSKKGYLLYRLGAPVLINTLLTFLALILAGYSHYITWALVPVIVLLALEAPLVALFVAGIAKNKVEGLAVAKIASILLLVPFLYYFVEGSWKYLGGVLPTFWTVAAFLERTTMDFWFFSGVSILTHVLFLYILFQNFKKTI